MAEEVVLLQQAALLWMSSTRSLAGKKKCVRSKGRVYTSIHTRKYESVSIHASIQYSQLTFKFEF
jgi:hypothetical protein